MAETSPGFSRDFPGGGWSLVTAGCAALAAGILQKRSAKLARLVLILGFFAAGTVLLRGCADSARTRKAQPFARTP